MSRRLGIAFALVATFTLAAAGCGAGAPAPQGLVREGADAAGGPKPDPGADRKIIFTATLSVVVKDLAAARAEVDRLLAAHGGYVARSEVEKRDQPAWSGTASYTLRVPAAGFRPLIDGLAALGHPERNAVDSQDVTEEFVDLRARLESLKKEEAALDKLLEKAAQPADVTLIRKERYPVREGIDKAEGRLKYLSTMTTLSTVNLTLREVKDYQPPTAPTFDTRVGRTFRASWEAVVSFGEGVALFAVALTPWLPVLVPAGAGLYYLVRRARRASAASAQESVRPLRRRARPVDPEPPPAADEPPTPPAG